MKRKTIQSGLLVLALTLVLCTGVKPALAYFTDTASAAGSVPLNLGYTTTIDESVKDLTKTLTIQNTGDTAVYVRARAYVGGGYTLTVNGTEWTKDGDWYVFGPVPAKGTANALTVTVSGVPAALADGDSFNVAVVYESTPVQYHEDGTPYADWSIKLDTGTSSSSGSGTEGG